MICKCISFITSNLSMVNLTSKFLGPRFLVIICTTSKLQLILQVLDWEWSDLCIELCGNMLTKPTTLNSPQSSLYNHLQLLKKRRSFHNKISLSKHCNRQCLMIFSNMLLLLLVHLQPCSTANTLSWLRICMEWWCVIRNFQMWKFFKVCLCS